MSYIMDDPRESVRLGSKVDTARWVDRYLTPHLREPHAVLDVGCGPGVIAAEVARRYRAADVTGIDLVPDRLPAPDAAATPGNLALVAGDARALNFPDDSFDLAYCRFLLEYLAERDRAVAEMTRVCKPGGCVLLQDLDGQLVWHFPPDEALEEPLTRIMGRLAKTGFDPFVGRKLFSLAQQAGLTEIRVEVEPYHLSAGRIDKLNLRLWELKLDIALPAVIRVLGSEASARALKERFLDYLRREDTLTYSVVFTVVGMKPRRDTK